MSRPAPHLAATLFPRTLPESPLPPTPQVSGTALVEELGPEVTCHELICWLMKCGSSSAKIRCPPPQRPVVLKWTTAAQPRVHAGRPGTAFDFVSREEPLSSGCVSHHKRVAYRSVCGRPSLHDLFFFNFNHTICTRVVDPNPHEEERLEEEFNDPHEVCAQ